MRTTSTWPRSAAACRGVRSICRSKRASGWVTGPNTFLPHTHHVQRSNVRLVLQQHDTNSQAAALASLVQGRAAVLKHEKGGSTWRIRCHRLLEGPADARESCGIAAARGTSTHLVLRLDISCVRQQHLCHLEVPLLRRCVQRGAPVLRRRRASGVARPTTRRGTPTHLALRARVGAGGKQQLDHFQVALVRSGVQRCPILLHGTSQRVDAAWRHTSAAHGRSRHARVCSAELLARARPWLAVDASALGWRRPGYASGRTAVVAVTLAPLVSSSLTSSKWPWYAARCSDARPSCERGGRQ